MTTFDEREASFEKKFAHDAEMLFRAAARRNKLLGLWVAPQIGRDDAEAYAKEVVIADLKAAGDDDVHAKVLADLEAAGAGVDGAALRAKMTALMAEARVQIMNETRD